MESCLTCGVKIDVSYFPEHRELCEKSKQVFTIFSYSKRKHKLFMTNRQPEEGVDGKVYDDDDNEFETLPSWRACFALKDDVKHVAKSGSSGELR